MQLIGMLDSPYVRRTAISLKLLGIPFEHQSVSVFSTFERFQKINPVVKAPSFVCDNGEVLMDSTLIIDYAEFLAKPGKSLMPSDAATLQREYRLLGLVLAACEKSVQIVYETKLRPQERQHEPWLNRVRGQLLAAFELLESEVATKAPAIKNETTTQAGVTIAVVWQFVQSMLPDIIIAAKYPTIRAFAETAERLPAFLAYPPDGPGVPSP